MLSAGLRQRYLQEMGYTPLRRRGSAAATEATAAEVASPPEPAVSATLPARPRPDSVNDPLWQALLRAAAANAEDIERLGWESVLRGPAFEFDGGILRLNPIALRGNPDAKRALWKTLRKLRRRHLQQPS